jgi:putative phage-type endonuclease
MMVDLKARKKFIGSSDAAAVLGLSRWSTPLEVWALKTGAIEKEEGEETLAQYLGKELEETVAQLFSKKTGLKVRRANEAILHKDHPFLGANIDRAVVGKREGLECKTASGWKAKEWAGEEIPQEYIIQCHHCLAVTGWDRWHLAVLIGNQDFVIKVIERDEALLKTLVDKEKLFWEAYVEPKVMPGIITANDSDVLYRLFPAATPNQIELPDEITRLIEERNALVQDVKSVEKQIDQHENAIKAALKDNEAGVAGKWLVTWKNQSQVRLDTDRIKLEAPQLYAQFGKETKFRQLRFKEMKNG